MQGAIRAKGLSGCRAKGRGEGQGRAGQGRAGLRAKGLSGGYQGAIRAKGCRAKGMALIVRTMRKSGLRAGLRAGLRVWR